MKWRDIKLSIEKLNIDDDTDISFIDISCREPIDELDSHVEFYQFSHSESGIGICSRDVFVDE